MIGFLGALVNSHIWELREVISRPDLTRPKLYVRYSKIVNLVVRLDSVFNCTSCIRSGSPFL